ncbi:hypothetical protein SH528x_003469 [Novipirellula sp. SH528]|uniref:hypothetical protein n=1 Tax=Novipirellula sp. SH528 TaxID=3454466 RepID=UPI003FA101BC
MFECQSGELLVGDLINDPARYRIPHLGICHLPASAIHNAAAANDGFSVDHAQIFIVDAPHYQSIRESIRDDYDRGAIDHALCEALRTKKNTAFGYVVAGELFDCDFNGDGTYRFNISLAQGGLPKPEEKNSDARELLRRIASSMNTLVCASCFSAEIVSHPDLGMSPGGRAKAKKDWCIAMAEHAIGVGWTAVPEKGSFGDITPLCPECKAQRRI